MQKTLRAFVAVPVPDAVAVFMQKVQARLQVEAIDIRWVAVKNIHLTLKFLGDIEPSRVCAVAAQMDLAAEAIPSFSLAARGAGVFPNRRHARVLWVGLAGDRDRLKAIQATLESGLETIGFPRESRGFDPHLTIGRTRRPVDAQTISAMLEPLKDDASDVFRVDRLVLIKSILKPSGPEYTRIHTSHLAV